MAQPLKESKHAQLELLLQRTELYSNFIASKLDVQDTETPCQPEESEPTCGKRTSSDETGSPPKKRSPDRTVVAQRSSLSAEGVPLPKQPCLIHGSMHGYQLLGLRWMVSLYENGLNGILADEMGLGKTLQVIALFAYLWERGVKGPFLVIVPLSTIANWAAECKKWAPSLPVTPLVGSKEIRKKTRDQYGPITDSGSLPAWPLVITTYEFAMKDKSFLRKHSWKFLVVDEGHRIKNLNCKLVKDLKQLSTANRLLLTGTPLQNNLQELWSLLNFLLPNIFNDWDAFEEWFGLDVGTEEAAQVLEKEQKSQLVSKLHRILRPFLLRRVKSDVAIEIPPKYDRVIWTPLLPLQLKYYKAILDGNINLLVKNKKCHRTGSTNQLMILRRCCLHPYLLEWPEDSSGEVCDERLVEESAKLQVLDRILQRCRSVGEKAVIFSQFTAMLDLLEDFLQLRDIKYCRLDGSTPSEERTAAITRFEEPSEGIDCFLISTRAGGLGINITAANHVIFYDADFNPQVDKQAHDRCHRIGQTRPVYVYRLLTQNSVESEIRRRSLEKSVLDEIVIQKGHFASRCDQILDIASLAKLLQMSQENSDSANLRGNFLTDEHIFHPEQLRQ